MLKGYIHPDFGAVARTFSDQIPMGKPGGASLCVFYQGQPVLDIWAGTKNKQMESWEEDTVSMSFSTTKGVASTLLHRLADQGLIDYDKPVAHYWPEFAQNGKKDVKVRHILCHEAGLFGLTNLVDDASRITDWEYMTSALAAACPRHKPGTAHGYHALTYGWLVGEICQRVTDKPFTQLIHEQIVDPLDLDGLFIGIPDEHIDRRAHLITYHEKLVAKTPVKMTKPVTKGVYSAVKLGLRLARFNIDDAMSAFVAKGIATLDFNHEDMVKASLPAANGLFTARSLAKMYAVMANGGTWGDKEFLSRGTLAKMGQVQNRGIGRVIPIPMHWRLGYHRVFSIGHKVPRGFGHFGFGGSGAWADPERNLSVALTLNSGVGTPFGDARIVRLNTAILKTVDFLRSRNQQPIATDLDYHPSYGPQKAIYSSALKNAVLNKVNQATSGSKDQLHKET